MNVSKYKIVYCTPALYSAGGVERTVSAKASYFAEYMGYDVHVIVTEGNGNESFFPLSPKVHVINLNLNFEELWEKSFFAKVWMYLKKQYQYKRKLRAELMRIRPDFTITTLRREINFINEINDGSIKIGELHLSRANFRGLEDHHSNILNKCFYFWWRRDLVCHLKKLDKFVVLTEKASGEWPELNNVAMIPDPLALNVEPLDCDTIKKTRAKRIITVGRYAYEKGYDLLLKAWAIVEKVYPDWCLEIYGMGDRTPYEKIIEELGINPVHCHFNGSLADVKSEYLKSSFLVLPSRTEGFGLVLIEDMACGLPVIAFNCENGPSSIVSDGEDGFLVPPYDIKALADKMILLIQDEGLCKKLSENGKIKSANFSIKKVAHQWQQLYDELMQNNKP